jgi:hypothetical protein
MPTLTICGRAPKSISYARASRQLPFLIYVVDGRINGLNRSHTMTTFIHAWLLPNGA